MIPKAILRFVLQCPIYIALFAMTGPAAAVNAATGNVTVFKPKPPLVRVAAAQVKRRIVDWHLTQPAEVVAQVEQTLTALERLVDEAGAKGCDVIAFPEDTLGLGLWEAGNPDKLATVLPKAVNRMLDRLGRAAARHQMYLICCNDTLGADASVRNTAFFLNRQGKELGRYYKVNLPIHEQDKKRGTDFPVFHTQDLGDVGMLICYDMVFPEAPRCLALGGADIIFHPTLGGAAIGDDDISRAAFRTRAVDNFVYVVVAQRGGGSMIISPQGKILAEGKGPDELVIADLNPFGGREGGDAMNSQKDMRARLFRERSPAAFRILTEPNPPVLAKVPETITPQEAVEVSAKALTLGEVQYGEAADLLRKGQTNDAIVAFKRLRKEYRDSWIDRVSTEQLVKLAPAVAALEKSSQNQPAPSQAMPGTLPEGSTGIAAHYPGDRGIERDPQVLFADNFETGSLEQTGKHWGEISNQDGKVMAWSSDVPPHSPGKRSLQITATLGQNTGGHLYTRLSRGVDKAFVRFYVKFADDAAYIHHFVTLGGYRPPSPWPQGTAGERPRGDDHFTVGIEPYGNYGRFPAPGAWNFYAYWPEMKGSADGRFWGNSLTPVQPALVPRNQWQCVEVMLQCNSAPEKSDGQLALWVDGKRVAWFYPGVKRTSWTGMGFSLTDQGGEPFSGFRWRTNNELKINFLWLMHYVTENAARQNRVANPNPNNRVWFDDVVVATEYIGPIQP